MVRQYVTDNAAGWLIETGLFVITGLFIIFLFATVAIVYIMEAGKAAAGDDDGKTFRLS